MGLPKSSPRKGGRESLFQYHFNPMEIDLRLNWITRVRHRFFGCQKGMLVGYYKILIVEKKNHPGIPLKGFYPVYRCDVCGEEFSSIRKGR